MGRYNTSCSVPGCRSYGKKENVRYHKFPPKNIRKVKITNWFDQVEEVDQRKAWIWKLKLGKPISKYMLVCSKHFQASDYLRNTKFLKKNAIPSMNLPSVLQHGSLPSTSRRPIDEESQENSEGPIVCGESDTQCVTSVDEQPTVEDIEASENSEGSIVRGESDTQCVTSVDEQPTVEDIQAAENSEGPIVCRENDTQCVTSVDEQPTAEDIQAAEALLLLLGEQNDYVGPKSVEDFKKQDEYISVQVNTSKKLTVCELITTEKILNTFTGLNSFNMLDVIVNNLKIDQRLHALSIKERVVLTFFKLKHNLSYAILGTLFGISAELCKTYIHSMLPHIASVLRPTIYFPTAHEIRENMPKYFKDFDNVRVVIDCTEIHIQKPKCLCCRIRFYSQYKSCETIKFMVGVSPASLITFVSKPYGGRASDKLIFEESDLIAKLDKNIDSIMADKGFLIDDICESFGINLIRPPFLEKKKQLSSEEALLNNKIAAARVHIERVNQCIKMFKILSGKLQWSLVPYINCIFLIACGITNLSAPILSNERFLP